MSRGEKRTRLAYRRKLQFQDGLDGQELQASEQVKFLPIFRLAKSGFSVQRKRSLKTAGLPAFNSSQMSGNPVKIRDGCATVKGYNFPLPLVRSRIGKAGRRSEASSQDTGLIVLVRPP